MILQYHYPVFSYKIMFRFFSVLANFQAVSGSFQLNATPVSVMKTGEGRAVRALRRFQNGDFMLFLLADFVRKSS
jgi:hypothetical protein